MNEYRKDAVTLIRYYNFSHLLRDEDSVGEIMSAIMLADHKFNGSGSIRGYRAYRAKQEMIRIQKRNNRHLHEELNEESQESSYLFDDQPMLVDDILHSMLPIRAYIIKEKIYNNSTFAEIANKLGRSIERVRQQYHDALRDFKELWMK